MLQGTQGVQHTRNAPQTLNPRDIDNLGLPRGSKYPIIRCLGLVIVIIVQVLGKYMIVRYLDP